MPNYERVMRYILEQPWAIEPQALGVILDIIEYRVNHGKRSDDDIDDLLDGKEPNRETAKRGQVAVIPLYGTIIPRANMFSNISGATSMETFGAALAKADRDSQISSIVIDVDSPGGSVELIAETAEKIRNLDTPTVAVANTKAASAAYYLASQADEVVVTPSGEVGSIGVWTAHEDISGSQRKLGVNTTLISAGKYKVEGNPFGPLDKTARDAMQAKVNYYYDQFVADVALGRGVSPEVVRNGFGEGRMVTAPDALAEGMVDRIATLGTVIAERSDGSQPVAASAVVTAYFDNPAFGVPGSDKRLKYDPDTGKWSCPPTLDGDHFYGHVAPMGLCLRGRADKCVTPPDGDLEGFMRHYAPGAGGRRTGVVTITDRNDHGHSAVGIGAVEATKWYDSVGRGVADVRVGQDAYGIWFSGAVRPGCSASDRYALAASDVSGHWEIGQRGIPMLVGLPAVNVGGYPKGYLTAEEVASGIAASVTLENAKIEDCGCDEDHAIDLETVLAFHSE